ncbi:MAG: hypothetical protein WAU01_10280, partial [Saprospiraceae bacterium]
PYTVKNGKTRHRFAQLELGVTHYISPQAGKSNFISNGNIQSIDFGPQAVTAFLIGGTHFWGHCDFAMNIPVISYGTGMKYNVDLQAKIFPWRMERNKLRPYFGISMSPFSFRQDDGPLFSKTYYPLLGGINYSKGSHQIELGATFNYDRSFDYHISRDIVSQSTIQPVIFNVTYKYTLETTVSAEKEWRDGTTAKKTENLAASSKLNNFSLAIGVTSAFRLKSSPYLSENFPYAGQHNYDIALESGVGYYMHKPDIHFNLAYRRFTSDVEAYGYQQTATRNSFTLEAYKYLFDYHGFTPFIGPNISLENLKISESLDNVPASFETNQTIKAGLTFGWDIRPNRIQTFILRTNLRWAPNLNIDMKDGNESRLDQLEFNFIQLVVYPQRWGKL